LAQEEKLMPDKNDPTTHNCKNRDMKMSWNESYFGKSCPYGCGFEIEEKKEDPK